MKISNHHICNDEGIPFTDAPGRYMYCEVKNFDHGPQFKYDPVSHPREYIVIHHTVSGSWMSAYNTFNNPKEKGSAHVIVDRDGTIIQCVPFDTFAWHAGDSQWANRGLRNGASSLNSYSIGIELVNWGPDFVKEGEGWKNTKHKTVLLPAEDAVLATSKHDYPKEGCGWQIFPQTQIDAAIEIAQALMQAYPTILDIVGHEDIKKAWNAAGTQVFYNNDPRGDPMTDRQDPGPAFPMAAFRASLLGLDAGSPEEFQPMLTLVTPEYRFLSKEPSINGRKNANKESSRPLKNKEVVEVIDRKGWFAKLRATNEDGTFLEGWFPERYLKRIRV